MADLLESMHQPIKLTHLIYKTNLSYSQIRKYLDLLLAMELIQELSEPNRSFVITEKGRTFSHLISPHSNNMKAEVSISTKLIA